MIIYTQYMQRAVGIAVAAAENPHRLLIIRRAQILRYDTYYYYLNLYCAVLKLIFSISAISMKI